MIYLLNKFDPELFFQKEDNRILVFHFWEATESRIQEVMRNNRLRSIFSKQEVINLFDVKQKIQMVQTSKIKLKLYDRLIIWTPTGRYFIVEITKYINVK